MIKTNGEEFKKVVKGENFMTPDVEEYYITGDYTVELSSGAGMDGEKIYGVTVVDTEENQHVHNLSRCLPSKKEALAYIEKLGKM